MKPLLLLPLTLLLASCAATKPPALTATSPGTFLRHGTITLDLKTDRTSYRDGDPVTITLTSSKRASVRLFNEDAEGKRVQLWPNEHSGSSGIVEAGKSIVIPAKGSAFQLHASAPYGINTLVAVASAAPFRPSVSSDDFFVDKGGMKSFARKGIAWSPATVSTAPDSATGEARLLYEVRQP